MPPRKQKQAASANASTSHTENIPSLPAPEGTMVLTKTGDEETHTPERSPAKRGPMTITEAQKQALMDNLQLEVTERARKLRAQYALQAQGLRARLEMRVNRIPQALRKRNIQDLLDEHADVAKPKPAAPLPAASSRPKAIQYAAPRASLKRTSEHFGADNKENADTQHEIPNPKKRTKTTTTAPANTKTARSKAPPSTILSPKSHNAHASKPKPLEKPSNFAARPASPVKPTVPFTTSSTPSSRPPSRAPSRQTKTAATKRAGTATGDRRDSQSSNNSAGTTIITKPGAKKAAPVRKAPTAKTTTATKRAPAVKKEPLASPPAATGRTLRRRP
ncbi:hypothetical protein Q7P37_009646 [Cladosporium fusiforme]